MIDSDILVEDRALDLARECVYRFLAAVATDPYSDGWNRVLDPEGHSLVIAAMDLVRDQAQRNPVPLTFGELGPETLDLRPLVAELARPLEDLQAEHDRVFGLVCPRECPPYETEYHPPRHTFFRSGQTADIAGFYRAFGIEPGGSTRERPDHLALELEFIALLMTRKRMALDLEQNQDGSAASPTISERVDVCDQALQDFVRDHLVWWVPAFATGLRRKADHGPYHALATILAGWIPAERAILGIDQVWDRPVGGMHGAPDGADGPDPEPDGCP